LDRDNTRKEMNHMICDNLSVKDGRLFFAGQDTAALAEKYGTPLYLLDEDKIREKCRIYVEAFKKYFPEGSQPLYASKANAFRRIYSIMREEGMGIDVVSAGEIYTAVSAGCPMQNAYFHGNNKSDDELRYAMENGVGCIVIDSLEELCAAEELARECGVRQRIMLRITPGIDPHTYEAVATGKVDSKFGVAIETGAAEQLLCAALSCRSLELTGFHCHVGSQVFWEDVFERCAEVMLEYIADVKARHGFLARELDLGGGYGVPYVEGDGSIDIAQKIASVAETANKKARELGIELPCIHMEPGRSIVADAGLTLYTVGSVKEIPDCKSYVSVDGGMTDNPRFALYGSQYTCYAAEKMDEKADYCCSLVGRCCESGDIIAENVPFPKSIKRGDLVAVCTTGAYNYSMASNYNRVPRPPIVMLSDGGSYIAVKREKLSDICLNDV